MLLQKKFEKFLKSNWELNIFSGEKIIFRSKKSGINGLLDFLLENNKKYKNIIVFDKVVGRAVALLMIYMNAKEVYGGVGSKSAGIILNKYKVKFYFNETCRNILNKNKTDLCPMEKLAKGKSPQKFYNSLKK